MITAPKDGAVLDVANFTLSGRVEKGEGPVVVTLNGRKLSTVKVEGGLFSFPLTIEPGYNHVILKTTSGMVEATYEFNSAGGYGTYQFHAGYLEGECENCHSPKKGEAGQGSGKLCHSCHDRQDTARYLHGPVGAGQCTVCHDPHGSPNTAFATLPGIKLCIACHDQPGSQTHVRSSSRQSCEVCHNAHGSAKKYFLY